MTYRRIEETSHVSGHHRLGRHVNHDPQSRAFAHQATGRTLVSVRHVRRIPILDQDIPKPLGSCTGNAGTGALAIEPVWAGVPGSVRTALNESYAVQLYSDATRIDPYPGGYYAPTWEDTGSDGLSVAKVLKTRGLISGYTHAFSLAAALDALQDGPVLTGVNWMTEMDTPDGHGVVTVGGSVRGGHEFVADEFVKAGDQLADGSRAVEDMVGFDNSWGVTFGYMGRFYMRTSHWGELLAADGDVTILIPANQSPPQPVPGAASFLDADPALAFRVDHAAAMSHESRDAWLTHHLRAYFRMEV